ncbi:MAG TPA: LLM class flavin-dependent oxidoreductase [Dehalococcoidia bacterium]|nr:LLM class flavin-dependent oxidoreductase [Dehalococcoidia bacterium]
MSVRVGLAVGGWPFGEAESSRFWEFIDRAEALGFDSLWLSDRLVSTAPILEPITGLAAVAGRTRNMKFGMSVVVLPLRNPVVLAKEIATIDFLSNGRMLPAFGIGTEDVREYEAAGVAREERAGRTDEAVGLMRRLWSEEHVTHHGRYYHASDVTITPRPVQKSLPIWFGGRSEAAFRRVGRSGDGWLASFITTDEFAEGAAAIRRQAAAANRAIDEDHYGVLLSTCVARSREAANELAAPFLRRVRPDASAEQVSAFGTPEDCARRIAAYLEAGASKFVLRPVCPPEHLLDQLERLAREVAPRFDRTMAAA